MKVVIGLVLLTASLLTLAAQNPLSKLERVSFSGAEYVRLEDWGRANGFFPKWTTPKRELRLANGSATLEFAVDSRKISINGVSTWISSPIVLRNTAALIAPVDLSASIHPVLFPPRNYSGRTLKTICLDPGHGGKDPGNHEGRQDEKKYTLLLAKELSARLGKAGFKVTLTRTGDKFVELDQRVELARRRGADLFVSLHFNAADSPAVRGVEVYCMTPAHTSSTNARGEGAETGAQPGNRCDARNMLLAYRLQKSLVNTLGLEDRGVKRARFAVLRESDMPAVLVETGFMTNSREAKRIYDDAFRKQAAQAIADGVLAYKKLVEATPVMARNP